MAFEIARNWWVLALRGALAILFGILVFLWPGLAWVMVVASFAAYAIIDGVFAIMAAVTGNRQGWQWWSLVLEGLLGMSAGVLTLFWPGVTQLVLLFLIAYWAIATGVLEIIAAIRLRKAIEGEWVLALSGALSVLVGLALVIMPGAGALTVAWLIGAYAIAFGILLLTLGFRLRNMLKSVSTPNYAPMR